jgi:hypothetical protein
MNNGLYSPHPRRFYITKDGQFGLGMAQVTTVEWNLLSLFSRSMFSWDGALVIPEDKRDGEFAEDTVKAVRDSVHQFVGNKTVGELVALLDPIEMLGLFSAPTTTISHLGIVKEWGGVRPALLVMEARALTWLSVQPRKTNGKVVSLRALSPEQQLFINKINPWMNGEIVVS